MKLTRSRRITVNMGNYESFVTEASVEIEASTIELAADMANTLLDVALKADLLEASALSDVRNTYILTWNKERY